jgi:hypothetical protein
MVLVGFNRNASWRVYLCGHAIGNQFNRSLCQNGQVVKMVDVLHQPISSRDNRFLGIHTATKVMPDLRIYKAHETSRPLARMLMAVAVPAIVDIKLLAIST